MKNLGRLQFFLVLSLVSLLFANCTGGNRQQQEKYKDEGPAESQNEMLEPETNDNEGNIETASSALEMIPDGSAISNIGSIPNNMEPVSSIAFISSSVSNQTFSVQTQSEPSTAAKETIQSYSPPNYYNTWENDLWIDFNNYVVAYDNNVYVDLKSLNPVSGQLPANAVPIRNFCYVLYVDNQKFVTRYTYTFYENGFVELTECPSNSFSKSCYFEVEQKAYNDFLSSADKKWYSVQRWKPLWTEYAIAKNIQNITFTSSGGHSLSYNQPSDPRLTYW